MPSKFQPTRYVLLVGVDFYKYDGSRERSQQQSGLRGSSQNHVGYLKNLKGCVNDVKLITKLLDHHFSPYQSTTLTSSSPTDKVSEDRLPTLKNIEREFKKVIDKSRPGDMFFFHFSGHGALIPRVKGSPHKETDPSLMTMDYCCGGKALRGWKLNQWLRRLSKKKVQVIVTLDSCYSAKAWRNSDTIRCPEEWSPCNLGVDEEDDDSEYDDNEDEDTRKSILPISWGMNPEGFTLMAACQGDQSALEREGSDGQISGIFTTELSKYFKSQKGAATAMYQSIRDHIAKRTYPQKPEVYGQDRLTFFRDKEPVLISPILAEVKGKSFSLPVGKIHGITEGTQFTTLTRGITISISKVTDFESEAKISKGRLAKGTQEATVLPSRWKLDETIYIYIAPGLSRKFREKLPRDMLNRVRGDHLKFTQNSNRGTYRVEKRRDSSGIDIFAPKSLTGYSEGAVRGLNLGYRETDQQVANVGLSLSHLIRFNQVLNIHRGNAELNFTIKFSKTTVSEGENVDVLFTNNEDSEVNVVVLSLNAGFEIEQIHPKADKMRKVPAGQKWLFNLDFGIPTQLKGKDQAKTKRLHRDIIRTIVTRETQTSFKSLTQPEIWNVDQSTQANLGGLERKTYARAKPIWCQEDNEVFYS